MPKVIIPNQNTYKAPEEAKAKLLTKTDWQALALVTLVAITTVSPLIVIIWRHFSG